MSGAAPLVDHQSAVRTNLWGGPVYLAPDPRSGRLVPCGELYAGAVAVVHNVFRVLENLLCAELHAHFDRVPDAIRATSAHVEDVHLSLRCPAMASRRTFGCACVATHAPSLAADSVVFSRRQRYGWRCRRRGAVLCLP